MVEMHKHARAADCPIGEKKCTCGVYLCVSTHPTMGIGCMLPEGHGPEEDHYNHGRPGAGRWRSTKGVDGGTSTGEEIFVVGESVIWKDPHSFPADKYGLGPFPITGIRDTATIKCTCGVDDDSNEDIHIVGCEGYMAEFAGHSQSVTIALSDEERPFTGAHLKHY